MTLTPFTLLFSLPFTFLFTLAVVSPLAFMFPTALFLAGQWSRAVAGAGPQRNRKPLPQKNPGLLRAGHSTTAYPLTGYGRNIPNPFVHR